MRKKTLPRIVKELVDPVSGLTPRKILFACLVAAGVAQGDAAQRAFKYKKRATGEEMGSRMMSQPLIMKYIKNLKESAVGSAQGMCDQARAAVEELALVSFSDPANYVDAIGLPAVVCNNIKAMGPERRAISDIEITVRTFFTGDIPITETKTNFKFHSKMKALELIGKHHQLYTDLVKAVSPVHPGIYELPDNGMREKASPDDL